MRAMRILIITLECLSMLYVCDGRLAVGGGWRVVDGGDKERKVVGFVLRNWRLCVWNQ